MTQTFGRWSVALILAGLVALTGCGAHTVWETQGTWRARFTVPDSLARDGSSYLFVPPGGSVDDQIRLCDTRDLGFGLPVGAAVPGLLSTASRRFLASQQRPLHLFLGRHSTGNITDRESCRLRSGGSR